ncbi:hypothetical protein MMC20_002659 [Loxospora ochrophaea]|nr:hypothetical protein [Loxospora ochrophaea]
MAELLGIVSAAVSIAEAGFQLGSKLYSFAGKVRLCQRNVKAIARDIRATSSVLEEVGDTLKDAKHIKTWNANFLRGMKYTVGDCKEAFQLLEKSLQESMNLINLSEDHDAEEFKLRKRDQLKWPFVQPKMDLLRCDLDRVKLTLQLQLTALILGYKKQAASGDEQSQALVRARHSQFSKLDEAQYIMLRKQLSEAEARYDELHRKIHSNDLGDDDDGDEYFDTVSGSTETLGSTLSSFVREEDARTKSRANALSETPQLDHSSSSGGTEATPPIQTSADQNPLIPPKNGPTKVTGIESVREQGGDLQDSHIKSEMLSEALQAYEEQKRKNIEREAVENYIRAEREKEEQMKREKEEKDFEFRTRLEREAGLSIEQLRSMIQNQRERNFEHAADLNGTGDSEVLGMASGENDLEPKQRNHRSPRSVPRTPLSMQESNTGDKDMWPPFSAHSNRVHVSQNGGFHMSANGHALPESHRYSLERSATHSLKDFHRRTPERNDLPPQPPSPPTPEVPQREDWHQSSASSSPPQEQKRFRMRLKEMPRLFRKREVLDYTGTRYSPSLSCQSSAKDPQICDIEDLADPDGLRAEYVRSNPMPTALEGWTLLKEKPKTDWSRVIRQRMPFGHADLNAEVWLQQQNNRKLLSITDSLPTMLQRQIRCLIADKQDADEDAGSQWAVCAVVRSAKSRFPALLPSFDSIHLIIQLQINCTLFPHDILLNSNESSHKSGTLIDRSSVVSLESSPSFRRSETSRSDRFVPQPPGNHPSVLNQMPTWDQINERQGQKQNEPSLPQERKSRDSFDNEQPPRNNSPYILKKDETFGDGAHGEREGAGVDIKRKQRSIPNSPRPLSILPGARSSVHSENLHKTEDAPLDGSNLPSKSRNDPFSYLQHDDVVFPTHPHPHVNPQTWPYGSVPNHYYPNMPMHPGYYQSTQPGYYPTQPGYHSTQPGYHSTQPGYYQPPPQAYPTNNGTPPAEVVSAEQLLGKNSRRKKRPSSYTRTSEKPLSNEKGEFSTLPPLPPLNPMAHPHRIRSPHSKRTATRNSMQIGNQKPSRHVASWPEESPVRSSNPSLASETTSYRSPPKRKPERETTVSDSESKADSSDHDGNIPDLYEVPSASTPTKAEAFRERGKYGSRKSGKTDELGKKSERSDEKGRRKSKIDWASCRISPALGTGEVPEDASVSGPVSRTSCSPRIEELSESESSFHTITRRRQSQSTDSDYHDRQSQTEQQRGALSEEGLQTSLLASQGTSQAKEDEIRNGDKEEANSEDDEKASEPQDEIRPWTLPGLDGTSFFITKFIPKLPF